MLKPRVKAMSTRVLRALLCLLAACLLLGAAPTTAAATTTTPTCGVDVTGNDVKVITNDCTEDGGTTPGRDSTTKKPLTCTLVGQATYCRGTEACFISPHVVPWAPPPGESPGAGAEWGLRNCVNVFGEVVSTVPIWVGGPVAPPLVVQAQNAVGRLPLPRPAISTDPRVRAIVNLETRFTPAQVPDGPLRGTAALGLVAVAEPVRWVVTPGDGASPLSCAVPVTTACQHTFERSSAGAPGTDAAGLPAYRTTAFMRWAVSYELDGDPVVIEGAPDSVDGPTVELLLPVAEIQSLVVAGE